MEVLVRAAQFPRKSFSHWVAAAWMAGSLCLATWLTPNATWYDRLGRPGYAALVPERFGDWVDTGESDAGMVSALQGEALHTVYSQLVGRTYLHRPTGRRIMLSMAYGQVQQGATQLHRPESCYSSQGFEIRSLAPGRLTIDSSALGVFRMTAVLGPRTEQVTYWIRMGDRIIDGPPYELNLTRMAMGLKGMVADGLLFRVSEITPDAGSAQRLQERFVQDLVSAVPPAQRVALIGQLAIADRRSNP